MYEMVAKMGGVGGGSPPSIYLYYRVGKKVYYLNSTVKYFHPCIHKEIKKKNSLSPVKHKIKHNLKSKSN